MIGDRSGADFRLPNAFHALVGSALRDLRAGELTVVMPDGREHLFAGGELGPSARILVKDPALSSRLLAGGEIAFAEAYMDGWWETPDLDAVLDLALANLTRGWGSSMPTLLRPLQRALHAINDNNAFGGAKRNVARHYDLGNDFFRLWLDPSMTYSSACIEGEDPPLSPEQLECAQRRKWDRILELIDPGSRDHVLEIGCGWGGFAVHAARETGCRVTGITLSEQQAALARTHVAEHGLEGRVDILLEDYRRVGGTYSAIASIEMFEAVGLRWWPVFFRRLHDLLEPGRAAAFQVITIDVEDYEDYVRYPDFIQRYVFPGGVLPTAMRFRAAAEDTGLVAGEPRFFGHDYAVTLAAWRERFERALPEVRALGYDERFIRMWRYYLASCRSGFEDGFIDVMQLRLLRT